MPYSITSFDDAQALIDEANDYYIGVELSFCDYVPELKDGDTYVRVFADNEYDDDGSKILLREFYMTGNTFNALRV